MIILSTLNNVFLRQLLFAGFLLAMAPGLRASGGPVLVLGDSISAAYGMSLDQGWVALMAVDLQRDGHSASVINASISGETTSGGLRRLPALLESHQPGLVIVELGGNDGLRGHPIGKLRQNLTDIVSACQGAGARVLLLPMEIPPNYGSRYARAFRDSFRLVAEETGARLGSFPMEEIATGEGLMQADGIHPTVKAQALIAASVLPQVQAVLEAP